MVVFGKRVTCRASLFVLARFEALPGRRLVGLAHRDDAVCIDQNNIEEKNQQVQQMGRIYSGAQSVLVWLGPASSKPILPLMHLRGFESNLMTCKTAMF